MIKAVFFDIDNTLLDFNKCAIASINAVLKTRGVTPPENLKSTFVRINDSLWRRIERGELTLDGLREIRFNLIFKELGIGLDGVEFEQDFKHVLSESAEKVEGAEDILEYLSGRYRIFAASNAPLGQQTRRLELAGLLKYFEKVFTSGLVGYSKPSPEFFEGCMSFVPGLSRKEIIIIGDSLTADIIGGSKNGFKTCWFNYSKAPIPEDFAVSESARPDYTVFELSEIKNIL